MCMFITKTTSFSTTSIFLMIGIAIIVISDANLHGEELEPVGNCEIELEKMQNCFNPNSRFELDSNGIYNYLSNLYQHFLHCVF